MQVMIKQMHKVWMKSEAGKERSEEQISISGVGRARCSSQDEGNDGFPGARVVLEPLLVVSVVHAGSGPDAADGEEGEGEGWQRPDSHSVSTPLHDLPEVVRPRHKLEHAPMRDSVDDLSRFPQPTQDGVTVDVDDHTERKHSNTCSEAGAGQPGVLKASAV